MAVETTGKSKGGRPLTDEELEEYKKIFQDIEDTSNTLKKQEEKRNKK